MTEVNKCFCDEYNKCVANPNMQVSRFGRDLLSESSRAISGSEFVRLADEFCSGTKLSIDSQAGKLATVSAHEDTVSVTYPREAVDVRCWIVDSLIEAGLE